jgi:hypothetical protein
VTVHGIRGRGDLNSDWETFVMHLSKLL